MKCSISTFDCQMYFFNLTDMVFPDVGDFLLRLELPFQLKDDLNMLFCLVMLHLIMELFG